MHLHFPISIVESQLRAKWLEVILVDGLSHTNVILPEAFQPDPEDRMLLTDKFCLPPDIGTARKC